MKKLLLETSFSKIYMIVMILITLLILGGYFSYAMFTVSKEKSNAISIITGNLTYKLEVDGEEDNKLVVPGSTTKEFTVTLSNPNNRIARFNFYYIGSLASNVSAGYIVEDEFNTPPATVGTNLEKSGSAGSSNIYKIRVTNNSSSSVTINLGVQAGLDYNDLTLPSNGNLFEKYQGEPVADVLLAAIDDGTLTSYDDEYDTFITGEDPNNYVWYSGKLWRAVSINNEARTTKLVTQWNISATNCNVGGNSAFVGSYMEAWLNDTSVDGFLGNLRDPDKFIVMDAKWDATMDNRDLGSIERPNGTNISTNTVGLLNMYEYQSSYYGTTYSNGYLYNGGFWWTLTPYDESSVRYVYLNGSVNSHNPSYTHGARPSINLKSNIKIVDGDGTVNNPYRLDGDNDVDLSGTLLKDRYSGEYIRFGNGENNLYRIVSHENGIGTKITSAEPLKNSGTFITSVFDANNNPNYSSTNTIGMFLNGEYLTNYVGNDYNNMIEDNTTWYLGTVGSNASYKLAKYTDAAGNTVTSNVSQAKVGLLRYGELMGGQFDINENNANYWTLTPYNTSKVFIVSLNSGSALYNLSDSFGVSPSMNLKSNVIITSGDGTKENPFYIALQ